MAIDAKVWNLCRYIIIRIVGAVVAFYIYVKITGFQDKFQIVGGFTVCILTYRIGLSFYRRKILPAKDITSYGKWAIVTGCTSGIGKEFVEHFAKRNLNIVLISRNESKLSLQKNELIEKYNIDVECIAFDFTNTGHIRNEFYEKLKAKCDDIQNRGGIGVLVNNVGISNEIPMNLHEFSEMELLDMLQCNINSTVFMTRTVYTYMKDRASGAIISISSGSGNHPTPMLSVYSATKAFITQFSRSMHVECWGTGVDFLVVTPYYVVSNQYKRRGGTLIAPMPSSLVEGTLAQLGKQYVWQGHGYWFHGLLGHLANMYPGTTSRYRKMMKDNRRRYDAKVAAKRAADSEKDMGRDKGAKKTI